MDNKIFNYSLKELEYKKRCNYIIENNPKKLSRKTQIDILATAFYKFVCKFDFDKDYEALDLGDYMIRIIG